MQRVFIAACAAVLVLGESLSACTAQRTHFAADTMGRRVVSRTPMVLNGHHVRIKGTIELLVVVGADGKPACIAVVRGHPILTSAAIASVKDWRFRPYRRNGSLTAYSGSLVLPARVFTVPD